LTQVVIVGSGPAGLGAALELTRRRRADVTVLERGDTVGGLAGSFELGGLKVDYGSHRLHPSCDAAILRDIREMLGDDLLTRPRHGRIHLLGRWIHFPLKPIDLMLSLPVSFAGGIARDVFKRMLPRSADAAGAESFASVLRQGLGETICRDFYFPYAWKIWGLGPEELSGVQARRRVKAGSPGKLAKKVLSSVPGFKTNGAGCFYYPRRGYGQIARGFHEAAAAQGARFVFQASVESVDVSHRRPAIECRIGGSVETFAADYVWSTIPMTALVERIRPVAPAEVRQAATRIHYRSMILIYLVVGQPRFSEFDAHYFPERDVPITRMSEPRNYAAVSEPADRTVLCAELPCARGDAYWNMSDEELGRLVQEVLERLRIPLQGPVLDVTTRRLPFAYPIYEKGHEPYFERLDAWLSGLTQVLTFGRQGLFAHDNTHHALAMAYAAVECLDEGGDFDRTRWRRYRKVFESHVVED
jgi:protoporphyrinogen oxidase